MDEARDREFLRKNHETRTPSTRCLLGRLSRTHTQQTDAHTDVSSTTGATPLFSSPRRGRPLEVQAPAITATARGPSPRRDDLPIHSALAEIAVDCRQCVPQRGNQRVSAPDRLRRRDATRPTRVRARRLRQGEGPSGAQRRPRGQTPGISLTNNALARSRAGRAAGPSRKSGSRAVRGHIASGLLARARRGEVKQSFPGAQHGEPSSSPAFGRVITSVATY